MLPSFEDHRSERLDVDVNTAIVGQRVAAGARDDQLRVDERSAGSVDEHVEVGIRIGRSHLGPQDVCQHLAWNERAPPNREVKFQTKAPVDLVMQTITFGAPSTSGWHSHPGVVLVVVPAGIPNSGLRINQDNPGCSVQ